MLNRGWRALFAGVLLLWLIPTNALADKIQCDDLGNCWSVIEGGGSGDKEEGSPSESSGRSNDESTVCYWKVNGGKEETPCKNESGAIWSSSQNCYVQLVSPQPPLSDPVWAGRTNGAIYHCNSPLGLPSPNIWMDSAPELPPPDPEVLAWRALAALKLKPIDLGIAPEPREANSASLGAVGLPVWLWADSTSPSTTGPISSTASERGYTVSIEATLSDIEWDLGDGGKTISCGIGTRFDPATMDPTTPVVCGRQAGYQKQGEYTITATSHWEVSWSGIGESGTIDYDRTTSGTVRIGEIQVVVRGR